MNEQEIKDALSDVTRRKGKEEITKKQLSGIALMSAFASNDKELDTPEKQSSVLALIGSATDYGFQPIVENKEFFSLVGKDALASLTVAEKKKIAGLESTATAFRMLGLDEVDFKTHPNMYQYHGIGFEVAKTVALKAMVFDKPTKADIEKDENAQPQFNREKTIEKLRKFVAVTRLRDIYSALN